MRAFPLPWIVSLGERPPRCRGGRDVAATPNGSRYWRSDPAGLAAYVVLWASHEAEAEPMLDGTAVGLSKAGRFLWRMEAPTAGPKAPGG